MAEQRVYSRRRQNELDKPVREEMKQEARERIRARSQITLTPQIINSLVQLVMDGNYPDVAAQSLGISSSQLEFWLSQGQRQIEREDVGLHDPEGLQGELYFKLMEAEADFEVGMVSKIKERIDGNKNWTGHMTYLERRFPQRWGRRDVGQQSTDTWEDKLRAYMAGRDDARR